MAVETDYNAIVFRLNDLTEELLKLKLEVEKRLLQEQRDGLEPIETHWVNLIVQMELPMSGVTGALGKMAGMVLESRPGSNPERSAPPALMAQRTKELGVPGATSRLSVCRKPFPLGPSRLWQFTETPSAQVMPRLPRPETQNGGLATPPRNDCRRRVRRATSLTRRHGNYTGA
jgi:hypothetical protein